MAVRESFKTKSGVELPLMNLRGKEYLQVAHRLVWLVEEVPQYKIETNFHSITEEYAICRATIKLFDDKGNMTREASATKKETKKDFADFVEKAETGSIGRCLAMLGMGTQFSTQDMEEGNRLADAPVSPPGEQNTTDTGTQKRFHKPKPETKKVGEAVDEWQ